MPGRIAQYLKAMPGIILEIFDRLIMKVSCQFLDIVLDIADQIGAT